MADETPVARVCCISFEGENHDMNGHCTFLAKLDKSYKKDQWRAIDSYSHHTATALARRVAAAKNGKSNIPDRIYPPASDMYA